MILPQFHEKRFELNDEVHARPSQSIETPSRLSYIVLLAGQAEREKAVDMIRALADQFRIAPPELDAIYSNLDFGNFRLTFERHSEFLRFTIASSEVSNERFSESALSLLPDKWVAELPGKVIVAAHVEVHRDTNTKIGINATARDHFASNMLIGAGLLNDAATAYTDFRIHADGFSRLLIVDRLMTKWQAGRVVQRLLEIETYRVMALLALPVARELSPGLTRQERELSQISAAMVSASETDEAILLDRLSRLQASIEERHSNSHYRFSAAAAYYQIVQTRIAELREKRIEGLQTFDEFTERRLAPAMSTCRAVAARQVGLAESVARVTQLLSTRVDLTRERQNQEVLESMNRRVAMQLRLQETVEGLSVAAVTYYVVGLIYYAAKATAAMGLSVNANLVAGLSIPVVAVGVAFGVRSIRSRFLKQPAADAD
ncbi:MAG: DUF3422 domain-containing protein [Pseudomonadota bacterium]